MKKMVSVGIVLLLAAVFTSAPVFAFEGSADAYVGVYSKYLWRGMDLSDVNDDFVVQPGVDVSISKFTASFWANISENTGEMNEVDLTLDYSTDLSDLVSISVGNIFYNVDGASDTNEFYLGVALSTILEPAVTVYFDYDEFDTVYVTLGVGHGIDVAENMSLSLGAVAGYLYDDVNGYGTNDDWAQNLDLSAGLDYAINDNFSIGASILYTTPLSDEAEDNTGADDDVTAGVTVTYAF